ncbi:MAG: hypothetical protein EOO89_09945 [Pedobacter sp.]|nr:MAG: hypothetical protein EOO89_09945 [Pedobacter sp.]
MYQQPIRFDVNAVQHNDSLKLTVANASGLPFWFTVFKEEKELYKGYVSKLDTILSYPGSELALIRIDHLWNGPSRGQEVKAIFKRELLNLKYDGPTTIYPGQEVNMTVEVKDAD